MKPTVGRIVHFYHPDGEGPFAAVVTGIRPDGNVSLCVFNSNLISVGEKMEDTKYPAQGHWEWPPRQPE